MDQEFSTLADVERYAAQHGVLLDPKDRARIGAAQRAAAEEYQTLYPPQPAPLPTFADKFNAFYPRFLAFMLAAGETVLTFAQTALIAGGVPLVLVLLMIVEHHRVYEGILLFDASPAFASFAALAMVITNLVLEIVAHYVENRAGYHEGSAARWSMRIWAQNMSYRLGLSKDWTPIQLSPAARYKRLLRLVTFTILVLALVGSMRTVIETTSGRWYEALWSIVTESDLLRMGTWLSGLLFAAAAVLTAQGLTRYVSIKTVEIVDAMHARAEVAKVANDLPYQADIDRAGAMAALAIVTAKIDAKNEKAAKKRPTDQDAPTPPTNGHSNGHGAADFLAMPAAYQRDESA